MNRATQLENKLVPSQVGKPGMMWYNGEFHRLSHQRQESLWSVFHSDKGITAPCSLSCPLQSILKTAAGATVKGLESQPGNEGNSKIVNSVEEQDLTVPLKI